MKNEVQHGRRNAEYRNMCVNLGVGYKTPSVIKSDSVHIVGHII
jgi:hypothetical protein